MCTDNSFIMNTAKFHNDFMVTLKIAKSKYLFFPIELITVVSRICFPLN